MNFSFSLLKKALYSLAIFSFFVFSIAKAQSSNICKDGDCSPEVFNIKLDSPLELNDPTTSGTQRTEEYKAAYLKIKSIKASHAQTPGWNKRYQEWDLGGGSCVRLYQLESLIGYEYERNAEFKKFIDKNEANTKAFTRNGFESSRRAMNLLVRMKNDCKREVKKLEKKAGPPLEELPPTYRKLGEKLGFFDEKGNLVLPSDNPAADKEAQTTQLKEKLESIPAESAQKSRLTKIGNGLKTAGKLLNVLNEAKPVILATLEDFIPAPVRVLLRIGKIAKVHDALKSLFQKKNNKVLLDKVDNLISKRNKIKEAVDNISEKPQKLKEQYDQLSANKEDLEKELGQQNQKISDLESALAALTKKKNDLQAQLDQPSEDLDNISSSIDDLTKESGDLSKEIDEQEGKKDRFLEKLNDLATNQESFLPELKALEDQINDFNKQTDDLDQETGELEKEGNATDQAEKEAIENKITQLKETLNQLSKEPEWQKELDDCETSITNTQQKLNPLEQAKNGFKNKISNLLAKPKNLLSKLSDLKNIQETVKAEIQGINKGNALEKINQLISLRKALKAKADHLTETHTSLKKESDNLDQKFNEVKEDVNSQLSHIGGLKDELQSIITDKTNLKTKLNETIDQVDEIDQLVNDFSGKYEDFGQKEKCKDQEELLGKITDFINKKDALEAKLDEFEEKLAIVEKNEKTLEDDTEKAAKEIKEDIEREAELKLQEENIKKEYGTDVKLEPVTTEEWAESFEVKRPYWDAVFHPDDEVVEGYKGRYFEVRLKDAEKNVKLLFGPGKYFIAKNDFRNSYGTTIGAFVSEALSHMKKADASKVQIFIQGSADNAGHNTFRGNLDEGYMYTEVEVLSQNDGQESFSNTVGSKQIPEKSFTNDHLPDLRGNYLKEMIRIYSKKLNPILLEGKVKKVIEKGERNAVIYLFIPDELLAEDE